MNISVRVIGSRARAEIAALQAQVKGLEAQLAKANAVSSGAGAGALGGSRSRKTLAAWGNQLQWTGRQLQYNWTLPLLLAGGAATKFALDNEKAMTHVTKVYGDVSAATAYMRKHQEDWNGATSASGAAIKAQRDELTALEEVFVQLSSHYGVAQKDVMDTAGAWAAAGVSGLALAKSTELSMKAAVLGDMDLAKATEALIGIQAQYSLNTKQLNLTLAELNAIENQTGISMQGLIDGFTRSAGVAREAGVDVRHLGAMLAALVPATGSAATAGNALKTIISRIMSPTKDAADVMKEFGVDTSKSFWQSQTAMERLMTLAKKMDGSLDQSAKSGYKLSDSQRQVVASVLGSRYQMNRFLVLMRELNSEHGYYQKALNATKNHEKVFRQETYELNKVLSSNPQRLKIMWYTMQNGLSKAIQPLIPYIIYLTSLLARMANGFANLDPSWQKFILFAALALAAVGPLVRYFGSLGTLIGTVGTSVKWLAKEFLGLFVAQSIEDGETKRITRSWILMIRTMLLTPFTLLKRGFLYLGAAIVGLIIQTAAAVRFIPAVFSALATGMALGVRGMFAVARSIPLVIGIIRGTMFMLPGLMLATWGAVRAIWVAGVTSLGVIARTIPLVLAAASTGAKLFVITQGSMWTAVQRIWVLAMAQLALIARTMPLIIGAMGVAMARLPAISAAVWAATAAVFRAGIAAVMASVRMGSIVSALAGVLSAIGSGIAAVVGAISAPVAAVIAGVIILIVAFRHQIATVWNNIVSYFSNSNNALVKAVISVWNNLPLGIRNALEAVVNVVRSAALAVYHWFSYLNPFARHSPSVVDNVQSGVKAVNQGFGNLSKSHAPIQKTGKKVTDLKRNLAGLKGSIAAQEKVVARWQAKVDAVSNSIEKQQRILDGLQKTLDTYQANLDAANQSLSDFANAPLKGMRDMEDQIFANQYAQSQLQLQMMQMEDAVGPLDKIQDKLSAIAGDQEMLRGRREELRAGGAGSDILKVYDDQLKKLDEQKSGYEGTSNALVDMQNQLDALGRKADELDLVKAVKFDKLQHDIANAADMTKELSFDTIIDGIGKAKDAINYWTPKVDAASKAVERQQAVIDGLNATKDKLQDRLDAEQAKLDKLKSAYDRASDAANKLNKANKKTGSAPYVSPALQNFRNAAGGNFADVGGGGGIPIRKNWKSQAPDIKNYAAGLADDTAKMFGKLNPFDGIKKKWDQFEGWMSTQWGILSKGFADFFLHAFAGISFGSGPSKAFDGIRKAWAGFQDWWSGFSKTLGRIWDAVWPGIQKIGQNAWKGIKDAWDNIWPELKKFKGVFEDLGPALNGIWNILKPVLKVLGAILVGAFMILVRIWGGVVKPLFTTLGNVIENVIQIIRGVFQVVEGFFMLFSKGHFQEGIKKMGEGILNIFSGLVGGIGQLLWGAVQIVVGAFVGMVKGAWDWVKWLWNELVGHSIVPDIVNGILFWFGLLKGAVKLFWEMAKPILKVVGWLLEMVVGAFKLWWKSVQIAWAGLKVLGKWFWNYVLKPVWAVVKSLWPLVKGLFKLWWTGIQLEWAVLKTLATWFWKFVLKPIWAVIKTLWRVVKPVLKLWWAGVKAEWAVLKKVVGWFWDHILKPILNIIKKLWRVVKPVLKAWWGGIKAEWKILKKIATWVWDNVLKPIWNRVKDIWSKVKGELKQWWSRWKSVWNGLKDIGKWIKSNVMDPVFSRIKDGWNKVKSWLNSSKDMLKKPAAGIVNAVISAVNTLIRGLNKISDILPGINFSISLIPKLEEGGNIPTRRVGSGFKTNGARAIVGEGKTNHPEFVIPTDPTHRRRAVALWAAAGNKLGANVGGVAGDSPSDIMKVMSRQPGFMGGVPAYDLGGTIGGLLGDAKDLAKGAASWMKGNIRKLASTPFTPFATAAKSAIGHADWWPPRELGQYGLNKAWDWVHGADDAAYKKAKAVQKEKAQGGPRIQRAQQWAKSQVGKPYIWGGVGPRGYDCSGFQSAITNVIHGKTPYSRVGATASFPWPGFAPGQGAYTIGSTKNYGGSGVGHMAGTLGNLNVESRGGQGVVVGSAARGWNDGGFTTHAHLTGLRNGGIVRARSGGSIYRLGEGRYDEAVTPLPKDWRANPIGSSGNKTEINIYGNLEFPNIKSGDDAEQLIKNLELLAKD